MLKVTLKKSKIKATKRQRETIRGLGLTRINSFKILEDTPAIRGMANKVAHLIQLEETDQ
ncbi:MAG: large subunit ribosomal protein [Thermodesulfobacteriota bacterium]|jgi:large subunit ribosomal protein L30|nr:large subunit ribosomal protein [Thermodesulfobacteriota bacterium]